MTIGYDVRDRIAYISFERREKHNAFRDEDLEAAQRRLRRLDGTKTRRSPSSSGGAAPSRAAVTSATGCSAPWTKVRRRAGRRSASAVLSSPATTGSRSSPRSTGTASATPWPPRCSATTSSPPATRWFQVTETRIGLAMPGLIPQLGTPAFAYDVAMTDRHVHGRGGHGRRAPACRLAEDGGHVRRPSGWPSEILRTRRAAGAVPRPGPLGRRSSMTRRVICTGRLCSHWASSPEARSAVAARAGGNKDATPTVDRAVSCRFRRPAWTGGRRPGCGSGSTSPTCPCRSPWTRPASLRILRWCETVGWLLPRGPMKSQTQTSPSSAGSEDAQYPEPDRIGQSTEPMGQFSGIGLVQRGRRARTGQQ